MLFLAAGLGLRAAFFGSYPAPLRREALAAASASLLAELGAAAPARSLVLRDDVVTLNNGLAFPKASFGLQIYNDKTAEQLTELAISVGFRNFFASVLAGNQVGFARAIQGSNLPREDFFICGTVISNSASSFQSAYELTKRGITENLKAFAVGGITYVDMIMLDYPGPNCESIRGQWQAFEEMLRNGKTKSLAVSNFSPEQLDCILANKSATVPAVNQLPFSVGSYSRTAIAENNNRGGILLQAWSPLRSGQLYGSARQACEEIGRKYGKSYAQVALRWIVQMGAAYSMQTKSKAHFEEDLNIFDFTLTTDEMQRLSAAI